MKKVNNILFVERKLNPTGGGVQRVSYTLGEKFRVEGYHVWYAFYMLNTDTQEIPEELKLRYSVSESFDVTYQLFRSFIIGHDIDTLIVQNVYFKKFCSVYERLKLELGINIITCLHENPDRYINKDKWGLTLPKVYLRNKLMVFKEFILGNRSLAEMKRVYALSDKYVLLSERFIPIWKNVCKTMEADKLVGINNPCSLEPVGIYHKENILLVVGRMEENQKRISNVLKIWKNLWRKHPDWKLIIVGDGPDLKLYKKISKQFELGNINFEGHSENVQNYYQKSRMFLMTSIWEGFGMTLVESMNAGCVPIAFDNFAALHDILDENTGHIVQSNNLLKYSNTVDYLMDHKTILDEMAKNGMRSARSKFSLNVIYSHWKDLFDRFEKINADGEFNC